VSNWSYGLVERIVHVSPKEEYKQLVLCEVYFFSKVSKGFCPVEWQDIKKKEVPMILEDLKAQMNNKKFWFKEEDFHNE
jgi:hypothetical protein